MKKLIGTGLGWLLYSPRRLTVVVVCALVTAFAVPLLGSVGHAVWWNTTQLPKLRAEAQARAEAEAIRAEHAKRVLPLPLSARDVPAGKGIRVGHAGVALPSEVPDGPEPTGEPSSVDDDEPTIDLMPSVAPPPDDDPREAVTDAAREFVVAYSAGDKEAVRAMMTGDAAEHATAGDLIPLPTDDTLKVVDVRVSDDVATAAVTTDEAVVSMTLVPDGDDWLVLGFGIAGRE